MADCPFCGEVEDATHVWMCKSTQVSASWDKHFLAIQQWYKEHNTVPELENLILQGLQHWRANTNPPSSNAYTELQQLQQLLGWQALFEGRPAKDWQGAQQQYYNVMGSRRTGKRWLIQLLFLFHNIVLDLWEVRNRQLQKKYDICPTNLT